MEKMPKLEWVKKLDYFVSYDNFYTLQCSGIDKEGRKYSYTAKIEKVNIYGKDGAVKSGYKAEYKSFLENNDFRAIHFADMKEPFEKLSDAKKWVTDAFKKQWNITHK